MDTVTHLPSTHSEEGSSFRCWIVDFVVISVNNLKTEACYQRSHWRQKVRMETVINKSSLTSLKVPFPFGSTNIGFTLSMRSACPFAW